MPNFAPIHDEIKFKTFQTIALELLEESYLQKFLKASKFHTKFQILAQAFEK